MTVNIDTAAVDGFASFPGADLVGAPTESIDLSISVTLFPDGTASVNAGSTYSGYPSLEVYDYQGGQPTLLAYVEALDISLLGTNNIPIPGTSEFGPDNLIDSPIGGGGEDQGGGSDDTLDPDQAPEMLDARVLPKNDWDPRFLPPVTTLEDRCLDPAGMTRPSCIIRQFGTAPRRTETACDARDARTL